jgi:two-component system, LytTR family, response regulator
MIKAVIIDDIDRSRTSLADDLKRYCPDITIVGEADSVKTGVEAIKKHKPDVVFLDIQLEDGNGFNILEQVGRTDFKVIFTTGSDEYGIKAVKFSALDYLLKPIDPDELISAVSKLRETIREKPSDIKDNLSVLIENLKNINNSSRRIALNSADRVHVVNVTDIIRCESQRNYTLFYIKGNKQILVTRTLKEFEEMLDDSGFVRIHHSHLINISYLREFVKSDGGYAVMTDNSQVPVAVRKKEHLMQLLGLH